MSKTRFTLKLHSLIGGVSFRPTLKYLQNTARIAETLEHEFEEWEARGDTSIVLNTQKKELRITPGAITYTNNDELAFEKTGTHVIEEAANYITTILQRAIDEFSIEEIRRVGFQVTQIVESTFNFRDLVDLIYRKFYSPAQEIRKISCDELRDVAFVLDAVKNGFSNHVSIGPVNRVEAAKRFANFYSKISQSSLSDNNLFIDVDVFLDRDLTSDTIIAKFKAAALENIRILAEYKHYLDL